MSTLTFSSIAIRPRDVQIANIAPNTKILRSRTWERLKFEIEYARQKGTTANSYLIQADKIALIDPPGESFADLFIEQLEREINLTEINYLILGHVNANRMVTIKKILAKAPQIKIICSKPGANTLTRAFPHWKNQIHTVRSQDILDLGQGHKLEFISIPTPRWADGLAIFDPATRILYTDKLFGVHVCNNAIWDEDWKQLDGDRRYYFDCLHAPQAKQVETILDKLSNFPAKCYAPGHGNLVRYSFSRLNYDYRQWCQQQSGNLRVALLYASAYGSTATIAQAIAQGLLENNVAVEMINCESTDPETITNIIESCDGFIIGSPTLGGHAPIQMQTALGIILNTAPKTKLAGVFGSFGWSGEAIDLIETKLRDGNYRFGFETIRVRFMPTKEDLALSQAAGAGFAQILQKNQKNRVSHPGLTEANSDRTEQAVRRIIGSLCVVSVKRGENHSGILTAAVSQASFNPPGIMLALAEDQNGDLLSEPGTSFVLNILKEGRNLRRYFANYHTSGNDPFAELATETANNGCLILQEALAYLECTVESRIKSGDRWLIYAVVNQGNLLETTGTTAISRNQLLRS